MAKVECELLRETRKLAIKRGLDFKRAELNSCPYSASCDGTFCPLIQEEPESLLNLAPFRAEEKLIKRINAFLSQSQKEAVS